MLRSDGTIYETEEAAARVYAPFGVTEEMFHYVLAHGRPLGGCYFAYMDRDDGRNGVVPHITDEKKARAVKLYDSGMKLCDVAKALGCSKIPKRAIMAWADRPYTPNRGEPCDAHMAQRVAAVVKSMGMTQKQFVETAGISHHFFKQTTSPAFTYRATLAKLMAAMPADVTAEWLLRGEGQPPAGIDFEPPEGG